MMREQNRSCSLVCCIIYCEFVSLFLSLSLTHTHTHKHKHTSPPSHLFLLETEVSSLRIWEETHRWGSRYVLVCIYGKWIQLATPHTSTGTVQTVLISVQVCLTVVCTGCMYLSLVNVFVTFFCLYVEPTACACSDPASRSVCCYASVMWCLPV